MQSLSPAPGDRLGAYTIVGALGAGGMGEVYRATDDRLGRDVAIKVLPAAVADDPERLARFEREARVLASLNHPNIAAIHGLHEAGGRPLLVLELVEGEDLADRLKRGAIPVDETLAIAKQIAEALEEAHERGIVHRDLKPANVKVTPDGKVKVLDFGLAKAFSADPMGASGSHDLSQSPTLATAAGTRAGVILGTAAYMSPEQARGKAVDKRADIWAFGVVLFEMLTGRRLFAGETTSDVLAEVIKLEIDLSVLPEATPGAIRSLLRRCLERQPRNRLHDIADARLVLDDVLAGRVEAGGPAAVAPAAASRRVPAFTFAAGLVVGAALWSGLARFEQAPAPIEPPTVRALTYSGDSSDPSVSPDGRTVAFTSRRDGQPRVWLLQVESGEEVALTQGFSPSFSPDGATLLFQRGDGLYRIPAIGGNARRLAGRGLGAWSPDGREIAVWSPRADGQQPSIFRMPAEGGEARPVLSPASGALGNLAWSPDGTRLAFRRSGTVNSTATQSIVVVDVASGEEREIERPKAGSLSGGLCWDGPDALLYAWSPTLATGRGALLRRVPIAGGEPRTVHAFGSMPTRIALAGRGALVFSHLERRQNLHEAEGGRSGGRALTQGPTVDRQPAFSPDGKSLVFTSDRSGNFDLWSIERATGTLRRLTFDPADDWDPHWSPDGRHLLWSSNRGGHYEVWIAAADGTGARRLTSDGVDAENPGMSADGQWVVYSSGNPAAPGIWKIRADGSDARILLAGSYVLPELDPRTGWVAAARSDNRGVGGVAEVHVVRLDDGAPVGTVRVPTAAWLENAGRPRWQPAGTLLLLGTQENRPSLFELPVERGRETGGPGARPLVSSLRGEDIETFAVSPSDGRIVTSVRRLERDLALVEGIPGIGESLPERKR